MSLSLAASADGLSLDLKVGSTIVATYSASGIEAGVLLADAATAQGLTNAKKAISPAMLAAAFQGANQSLAASGYQKLPGGLILQWGTHTPGGGNSTNTVTFPVAFPTACLNVIVGATVGTTTGVGDEGTSVNATALTTTQFAYYYAWDSSTGSFVTRYLAIGY